MTQASTRWNKRVVSHCIAVGDDLMAYLYMYTVVEMLCLATIPEVVALILYW